ncbi:YjbH domain-containing protein [Elioraea sp.]|uniref:YjbH domain-containing protein n=1 Tax=Elioraea sp. TaxID=2185103 RepID=UPI00307E3EBD
MLLLSLSLFASSASAQSGTSWGGVGLIEMRDARFRADGALESGLSLRRQRRNYFATFQALRWLETTFRFTERLNATTGRGTTTDRSFDVKIRLLEEHDWRPAVAIGLQDLMGTGIYAGEYLVASKRWYDLDFTLGLGWGRLGTGRDLDNPFCERADRFCERGGGASRGGVPLTRAWFRGRDVAAFGGIAWRTPIPGLTAKIEFSGDTLRDERRDGRGSAQSRVNLGLSWQPVRGVELGAAFVHGSDLVLRGSVLLHPADPPRLRPPPPVPAPPRADLAPDWGAALIARLRADGMPPMRLAVHGAEARIVLAASRFRTLGTTAGRVARIAADHLPAGVDWVVVSLAPDGAEVARVAVLRDEVEKARVGLSSPEEIAVLARLDPARPLPPPEPGEAVPGVFPRLSWTIEPRVILALMDPDKPLQGEVMLAGGARVALVSGFTVGGELGVDLFGNLRGQPVPPDTRLPNVRTDVGRYLDATRLPLLSLTAERIWAAGPDLFARATVGYLEMMYGGVQGEVLWRPVDRAYALGADLAWVKSRDYDQGFGFRNYETCTGHVSLYLDLPYRDLYAVLRAGRYLARDWGVTLELGRRFDSGIEIGGFATFTTASFEAFGEGSFDKGIYLRVPFDLFGTPTPSRGTVTVRPLIRDGGQRLAVERPLWEVTREGRREAFLRGMSGLAPGR